MKKTYYGSWSVNNGASYSAQATGGTNLQKLVKEMRDIANGNRPAGNTCSWQVMDESGEIVASGGTYADGRKYRDL